MLWEIYHLSGPNYEVRSTRLELNEIGTWLLDELTKGPIMITKIVEVDDVG